MTNSHSRATQKEGRNSERNNASPNHQKNASNNGQNGRKVTFFNDNNTSNNNNNNSSNNNKGNKGYYAQKHSSSGAQYYSTSPKEIVTPPNHAKNRHPHPHHRNHHNGSPHGLIGRSPPRSPISFASPAGVSTTTPNLHFAGSKYFDAPSPNALPRPPGHWTSQNGIGVSTVESATSKRRLFTNDINQTKCSLIAAEAASKNLCSDIFSHNLKLLLNVQA